MTKSRVATGVLFQFPAVKRYRFFTGPEFSSQLTIDNQKQIDVLQYCVVAKLGVDIFFGKNEKPEPLILRIDLGPGRAMKTMGTLDQSNPFWTGSMGLALGFGGN